MKAAVAAVDSLEWPAASAAMYATKLQKRLERKWKDQRAAEKRRIKEEAKKAVKKAAKKAAKSAQTSGKGEEALQEKVAKLRV